MLNESKSPIIFGSVTAAAGIVLIGLAALWKNTIVQTADTNDSVVVGNTIDGLLVGGLVILGALCIIAAIILFLAVWIRSQRQIDQPVDPAQLPGMSPGGATPQGTQPNTMEPTSEPTNQPEQRPPQQPQPQA